MCLLRTRTEQALEIPGFWLRSMQESRTLVASDVPAGSLPITALVTVGGRGWTEEITLL